MTDLDALALDEDQTITITVKRWREHIAAARNEALEKAALECDHIARQFAGDSRHQESIVAVVCRDFIRALKEPPA